MNFVTRLLRVLVVLSPCGSALAGDMLKPWASVATGPNFPTGYHWLFESYDYESDCVKDNVYQLSVARSADELSESRKLVGARLGCVYQGSKSHFMLKWRNMGNDAVLCIAKEKKLRDYRVVLVGSPPETDDYRCE